MAARARQARAGGGAGSGRRRGRSFAQHLVERGLRVAAVSNVSIVSVAALIGMPQLGTLFTDGFSTGFMDPIVVGIVACVLLAFLFDLVINLVARALTPWRRGAEARA